MSKKVLCQDCHAIGELGDNNMLYDNICPICSGKLLRVHPDDFWLLEYHSDCQHMPKVWNESYTKHRKETTCIKYAGKFPKIRIIKDRHPCEKCRWYGTYRPGKDCGQDIEIGEEQKTLSGFEMVPARLEQGPV